MPWQWVLQPPASRLGADCADERVLLGAGPADVSPGDTCGAHANRTPAVHPSATHVASPGSPAGQGTTDWGAPVLVGEHPLAVLALVSMPVAGPNAEALGLKLVPQALVQRSPRGAARILLVAPQVQLALEELITFVTAERGLLCKTENGEVGGERGPAQAHGAPAIALASSAWLPSASPCGWGWPSGVYAR